MKATIHTIAKQCGVSSATVSRALRRHPSVKEDTMSYICQTAEAMGYRPNLAAKSLSHHDRAEDSTPTVFIPFNVASVGVSDPLFFDYFCGLTDCLGKEKVSLEIVRFNTAADELGAVEKLLAERCIAGVLDFHLRQETLESLVRADVPVVSSNWREPLKEVPAVIADHIGGYRQAWRYLMDQGHRRVAFFGLQGPLPEHYKECQAAAVMEEAADRLDQPVLTADIFSDEANRSALHQHYGAYQADRWPTLFFAQNDFIAVQLIKVLQSQGITVPGQLSVIGFDDSISAQNHHPPLSTIHKARVKVGYEMANLLLELIQGHKKGPDFIRQVPTSLMIRGTTAEAPRQPPASSKRASSLMP